MRDIHIRPANVDDSPALTRILTETNRETFQGLVPEYCLASTTLEQSECNWRKFFQSGGPAEGEIMLVAANDGGEVAGYIMDGRQTARKEYPRELSVLMMATPWQSLGIGHKLVESVAGELFRQGETGLLVGILEENPNWEFYERLGARRVGSRPFNWAGYETRETLYGWENLALLAQQE